MVLYTCQEDKETETAPKRVRKTETNVTSADRKEYEELFNIKHSRCYTEYGFRRTGCACCPYGKDFDDELKVLEQHEPNLCKAVKNIFHDSYEYTRQYREFRKEMENK